MREYSFRPLNEGEFDRLRPLWKEGFGDSDAFLDEFRDRMLRARDVQIALCGEEPVAMIVLFPTVLCTQDGEVEPTGSFYALTTLPEQRRRGIAARLLRSAAEQGRANGAKNIALSADGPELFRYYASIGWRDAFSVRETVIKAGTAGVQAVPIEAGEYTLLREEMLKGRDYIRWDARTVAFQELICRDSGGGLFTFQTEAPCCAAVEYGEDGVLLACELLAPDEILLPCAAGLMEHFSEQRVRLRMPAWLGTGLGGEVLQFGMLLPEGGPPSRTFERLTAYPMAYMGFDFC